MLLNLQKDTYIMIKKASKTARRAMYISYGTKYQTRYGRSVRILTTTFKDDEFPIVAAVSKIYEEDSEMLIQYSRDGRAREFHGRKYLAGFDLVDINTVFKIKG